MRNNLCFLGGFIMPLNSNVFKFILRRDMDLKVGPEIWYFVWRNIESDLNDQIINEIKVVIK
jgi:hypothetical protein